MSMDVWVASARVAYEDYHVIGVYLTEPEATAAAERFVVGVRATETRLSEQVIRHGYQTDVRCMTVGVDQALD